MDLPPGPAGQLLESDRGFTLVEGHSDAPRYISAQQEAVERMEGAAVYLCSRKGSEDDAPRAAWAAEVKKVAFAYGDQVVSKPEMLTWAQIEPGLPPEANLQWARSGGPRGRAAVHSSAR